MKPHGKPPFDPKIFLAKVGEGRTMADYQKNQIVLTRGCGGRHLLYSI